MLVEVKPVPGKPWHGKTGKESFARPKVIEVLVDPTTGRYATGLTPEEAKKLGAAMGVDLSDKYDPMNPHPYWGSQAAKIKLPNQTVFFNDENPAEAIKIKNLKASKYVANSLREYEEGLYPDATHIIYDESEEIKIKATKIQRRNQCIKLVEKLSAEEKAQVVAILSHKSSKRMNMDALDVEIDKLIDEDPDELMKYAKMDKQEMFARATIEEALFKNVLTKDAGALFYMGDRIANSVDDAIAWFLHPDNQTMKAALLQKLNK